MMHQNYDRENHTNKIPNCLSECTNHSQGWPFLLANPSLFRVSHICHGIQGFVPFVPAGHDLFYKMHFRPRQFCFVVKGSHEITRPTFNANIQFFFREKASKGNFVLSVFYFVVVRSCHPCLSLLLVQSVLRRTPLSRQAERPRRHMRFNSH